MIFRIRHKILISVLLIIFTAGFPAVSQTPQLSDIRQLVESFKKDERGPYQAIRWFCPDGTILPPKERCAQPGGIQHALHKDVVAKLAEERGIYLGQILAGTPFADFWDETRQNSRLKQYQLEQYLRAADDGWIMRRASYYRGAIQAEDEADWGVKFLISLAGNDEIMQTQFFLVRQAAKDIPHDGNDNRWLNIRALSKTIGDSLPAFTDLRVKLHGQPEAGDIQRVKNFRELNKEIIPPQITAMLDELIRDLVEAYRPFDINSLNRYLVQLPPNSTLAVRLKKMIDTYGGKTNNPANMVALCGDIAELLWSIRKTILFLPSPKTRLAVIDLSNEMEGLLFRTVGSWHPRTTRELLEKAFILAKAAAGAGFLETWEWESIEPVLYASSARESVAFPNFWEKADYAGRAVEWGTGMIRAEYAPVAGLFAGFEPLAYGFIDDRVRSSILLPLGDVAGELREIAAGIAGINNQVMGIKNQNQVRGLNPGIVKGELVVLSEYSEDFEFSAGKIYVLQRSPSDLKPVAGIATVAEGNLVSHVQLLARNLGIPNAVLSIENLNDLKPFSGQTIFYAVSPGGRVIMKPEGQMNREEKIFFQEKKRPEEKVSVTVDKIRLDYRNLVSLRDLRASHSGRLVGPKAANLGELKFLFPDKVVEGFAIPFGIFHQHLNQQMPGEGRTYWEFLQEIFKQAAKERKNGVSEDVVEERILNRLSRLREAIKQISLLPEFETGLRRAFREYLETPIGRQPVFIRSDTNMEDLKDFTGAGLNLTVFNVVEEEKILQGIRDVWASPYSERSYRWRQKYLNNPENVFPSVLILPTVDVDKSGVMITTGITSSDPEDLTIAFSRGAGGAVEGQMAESYLLRHDGVNLLLSPSREMSYTALPVSGGTRKALTHFHRSLLTVADLNQLRALAADTKRKMAETPGIKSTGPFDVELGFNDGRIILFQIRPYVENKRARSSMYLRALDPEIPGDLKVFLDEKLGG